MQEVGLVRTSTGEYPLLTLTTKGTDVMHGRQSCRLRFPDRHVPASPTTDGIDTALEELGFDQELFAKLKEKRRELAGNQPPYKIFPNATLEFFTRLQPKTRVAGERIRGVGKSKADKYLEHFLEIIRDHEKADDA